MRIISFKNNEATLTLTSNSTITVAGDQSDISNSQSYKDIILSVNVFDIFYSSSNNGSWEILNNNEFALSLNKTGQLKSSHIPLITCNNTMKCNLLNTNEGFLTLRFKKNLPSNYLIDINLYVTEDDEILETNEQDYILKDKTIEKIDFINSLEFDEKVLILQDGTLKQCDYPLILDHSNLINIITTSNNIPLQIESGKYMVQNLTVSMLERINNLSYFVLIQNNVCKICSIDLLRTELNI